MCEAALLETFSIEAQNYSQGNWSRLDVVTESFLVRNTDNVHDELGPTHTTAPTLVPAQKNCLPYS